MGTQTGAMRRCLVFAAACVAALFWVGTAQPGCVGIGYGCASHPCCNPFFCTDHPKTCPVNPATGKSNAPCCTPNREAEDVLENLMKKNPSDVILRASKAREAVRLATEEAIAAE